MLCLMNKELKTKNAVEHTEDYVASQHVFEIAWCLILPFPVQEIAFFHFRN